jgi:hypothetical protein
MIKHGMRPRRLFSVSPISRQVALAIAEQQVEVMVLT